MYSLCAEVKFLKGELEIIRERYDRYKRMIEAEKKERREELEYKNNPWHLLAKAIARSIGNDIL